MNAIRMSRLTASAALLTALLWIVCGGIITRVEAQCYGFWYNSIANGQAYCRTYPLYSYGRNDTTNNIRTGIDKQCFSALTGLNQFATIDTSKDGIGGTPMRWIIYGQSYTSLFVNENFILSFSNAVPAWGTQTPPIGNGVLMFPYWAHTDNRAGGGSCMYRTINSGPALQNCTNDVRNSYLGTSTFTALYCMVITWDNFPLFGNSNSAQLDTVQVVLISDGQETYSLFNYGQWTQGATQALKWSLRSTDMASQNGYPQIGFDAGDGIRYFSGNSSNTADMFWIWTRSNTRPKAIAGRLIYRVSDAVIVEPPTFLSPDANLTLIRSSPSFTITPAFDKNFLGPYQMTVFQNQQLQLAANLSSSAAALFIDGNAKGSGILSGVYTVSSNQLVSFLVIAQDESQRTYTLQMNVFRSPIAGLSALSILGRNFTTPFSGSLYMYVINLPSTGGVQTVTMQATSLESHGTITSGLYGPYTGTFSVSGIPLNYPGNTVFNVVSQSQDEATYYTYNITFNLQLSTVSSLASFTSNPSFTWNLAGSTYSTTVLSTTTQVVVTATTTFVAAKAAFNGGAAATNIQAVTLPCAFGTNTYQLVVTAEDPAFSTTFGISIVRPPSTNANVTSIVVTTNLGSSFTIPLSSFSPRAPGAGVVAAYSYAPIVPSHTTSVTVTANVFDFVYASATLNEVVINTGLASSSQTLTTDPMNGAITFFTVRVTAQDGISVNTYQLNVTKPAVPVVASTGACTAYTDTFNSAETKAIRVTMPATAASILGADCNTNVTGQAPRLWFSKTTLPNFGTGAFLSVSVATTASDTYGETAVMFAQPPSPATDYYLSYAAPASPTSGGYVLSCRLCAYTVTALPTFVNTTGTINRNQWVFYSTVMGASDNLGSLIYTVRPQLQAGQAINTQFFQSDAGLATVPQQTTPISSDNFFGAVPPATNPVANTNSYTATVIAPPPNGLVVFGLFAVADGASPIQPTNTFTIIATPPQPVITLVSPLTGPTIGGPSLAVVLTVTNAEPVGSPVSPTLSVTIGGRPCTALAYDGQGRILCTPPAGEGGNNAFVVTLYNRTSPAFSLVYAYAVPAISDVQPPNGPTVGNTTITVTGSNLGLTATVTVASKACTVLSRTTTTIICLTPAAEGVALVTVTAGGQPSTPTPFYFTYDRPVPNTFLSSYTATTGVTGVPNALIIWGTNFGSPTAVVTVTIANQPLVVQSWNQTVIICSSVAPGTGTLSLLVVTATGRSSNNNLRFPYAPPTLSWISPNPVPFGTTRLTLGGINFGPQANSVFNSLSLLGGSCTQVSTNHTQIVCSPPARTSGLPSAPFVTIDGQASNTLAGFGWVPPTINTASSFFADAAGTSTIVLFGVGFSGVDTSVKLNGATCTIGSPSNDTALGITIPPGSGTLIPLQVYVGGVFSNFIYINYTRPQINSISFVPGATPATDGSSTAVINGISFSGTIGTVQVTSPSAGTVACSQPSWSTTQISCSFPAGVGLVYVTVTVGGQTSAQYAVSYTAPTISGLVPSGGVTTAGGTSLTINGNSFGISQPVGGTVMINLVRGPTACQSITSWTDLSIVCVTPAGNGTGLTLVVTTVPGQPAATTNTYSHLPPAITGVAAGGGSFPTAGAVPIVITGTSFDSYGSVTVNGTNCPVVSWSQTSVTCTLPIGGGAANPVVIRTVAAGGGLTNPVSGVGSGSVKYDNPAIAQAFPNPSAAGQSVTLIGLNFGNRIQFASVLVGSDVTTITFLNQTCVIFTLSKAPSSGTPLITYTYAGQSGTITAGVTPPFISSLNPTHGPTGPAYNLTILGSFFGDGSQATSVLIAGARNCPVLSVFASQIVCLMPLGGANSQTVQVTVGTQSSNLVSFQYDNPVIQYISPNTNLNTGGSQSISIFGTSFGSNPSVTVGGTACLSVTPLNDSAVVCSIPAGVGSAVPVQVTAGALPSNTGVTVAYGLPILTSISPTADSPVGGTALILTGSGFGPGGASAGTVTVNGVSCPVVSASYSATQVTCTLPAGSGVNVSVIIRVNGVNSNSRPFSYFAPSISNIVAQGFSAPQTGGGTTVIISGSSFSSTVGTVSVNGTATCSVTQPSLWTTNSITCSMPALAGTVSVTVTVGGQTSNVYLIAYQAPGNLAISPSGGPTIGGTTLFITGTNLFTSGLATIGGFVCVPSGTKWTNTRIECLTPAGVGDAQPVTVNVYGQSATYTSFTYNAPTISLITPAIGPTNAGSGGQPSFPIAIIGTNFGLQNSGQVVVLFNTVPCTVAFQNQTYIACASVPNGVGTGVTVRVAVVTQFAVTTSLYAYAAPTLTSITSSGCASSGSTVVDCPITGSVPLTLVGANFGSSGSTPAIAVNVNGVSAACTGVTFSNTAGTQIVCTLPAGTSFNIPVTVTVGGSQTSNAILIAYAGPVLSVTSLKVLEDNGVAATPGQYGSGTGSVVLPDIGGSAILRLNGSFLSPWYPAAPLPNPLRFGVAGTVVPTDRPFTCTVTRYNNSFVECQISGPSLPVGSQLTFVYNDGIQYSRESVDTITFPTPAFVDGTIHAPGASNAIHVAGSSAQGEFLEFDVRYAGSDASLLSVYYDYTGGSFINQCTAVSIVVPYNPATGITGVSCRTQPGTGGPYVFKIKALNSLSAESHDDYSYPVAPIINSVSGCVDEVNGNRTFFCPTTGQIDLTILGQSFSAVGAAAKVGTNDCVITFINSVKIVCTLPAGTGLGVAVSVFAANLLSAPKYLLSYQPASVTSVSGCPVNANGGTSTCDRLGNTLITITGSSFGSSGAQVFVGASACTNLVHDSTTPQTKLTCYTPPGVSASMAVLLLQSSGALSNNTGLLGYAPCPKGLYEASVTDYACTACLAGSYTDVTGQAACTSCPSGQFQSLSGQSFCSQCNYGQYTPNVGYSTCLNCTAGQFTGSLGTAGSCQSCPSGSFSAVAGASACTACRAGQAYDGSVVAGVTACANCTAGSFSSSTGRSSCTACGTGSYSPGAGLTRCDSCVAGKFQSGGSGTVCSDCLIGTASGATATITCPACNPGRFANTTGFTICGLCAAGSYSGGGVGVTTCTACSPGSYQSTSGQGQCLTCPAGSFSTGFGSSSCTTCPYGTAGTPPNGFGLTACSNCTLGYAATSTGSGACSQCPAGTFSTGNGAQSVCSLCAPGKFSFAAASTACTDCGVSPSTLGTYNANSGQAGCQGCDIGFFASGTGLTECSRCVAGRYSAASGSATCIDCGVGYITNSDAQPLSGCVQCPAGSFSAAPVSTACTPCLAGQSTGGLAGAAQCDDCVAGRAASAPGSKVCVDCTAGFFANTTGLSTCSACAAGSISTTSTPGPTSCSLCTPGFFASSSGLATCEECPAGSFSNSTGASSCTACQPGEFQNSVQKTSCKKCTAGSANSLSSQSGCTQCLVGYFAPSAGMTSCVACPAGAIASSGNAQACTNCTKGSISVTPASSGCKACDVGSYNTADGLTSCTPCSAGTVQPNPSQSSCSDCLAGQYMPSTSAGTCLSCPAGQFSNVTGMSYCNTCGAGTFTKDAGKSTCTPCTAGTYQGNPSQTACLDCEVGSAVSTDGAITCPACTAGSYQDQPAQANCKPCTAGSFCPAGAKLLRSCAAGSYADQPNLPACLPCPIGSFCPAASVNFTLCGVGKFSNAASSSDCTLCDPGSFLNVTGQSVCSQCAPGAATSANGATTCTACLAGQIAYGPGSVTCTNCGAGSFSALPGSSRCDPCAIGTAQSSPGKSFCDQCADGSFAGATGSVTCSACPIGYAVRQVGGLGNSICSVCPPGTIAASTGAFDCSPCPKNSYVSSPGQGACVQCASGTFSNITGLSTCYLCGPGQYSQKDGAGNGVSTCSSCGTGTFSNGYGFSACLQCSLGSAQGSTGRTTCGACSPHQAQAQTGQPNCADCLAGSYAADNGTIQCIPCSPGSRNPNPGQESCQPCQTGRYQSASGEFDCIDCPKGQYMPSPGAVVCSDCPTGKFQDSMAQQTCQPCLAGESNSAAGKSACSKCTAGTFTATIGQVSCADCPAGSINTLDGLDFCTLCEPGKFQTAPGQTTCQLCAVGTFAKAPGQTQCTKCPAGTASAVNGTIDCLPCDQGSFSNDIGFIKCSPCVTGYFQTAGGQTSCVACPAGQYSNSTGLTLCYSCSPGSVQPNPASSGCTACTPGTQQPNFNGQTCTNCVPGTYSDLDVTQCKSCPVGQHQNSYGETLCIDCGAGEYSPQPGLADCLPCTPGTFINSTGRNTTCLPCPVATYMSNFGASTCLPCDVTTYGPPVVGAIGLLQCFGCGAGQFGNDTNLPKCFDCPKGRFQAQQSMSTCDLCQAGTFIGVPGQSACLPCGGGQYSIINGSTACGTCGTGTYNNDVTGHTTCVSCAVGTFSTGTGVSTCGACAPGSFSNATGLTTCTSCSSGYAQLSAGRTSCVVCAAGKFFGSTGASICTDCTPGFFCNATGMLSPLPCTSRTYQNAPGSTACLLCAVGSYSSGSGASACVQCSPGSYDPANGTTSCISCELGKFQNAFGASACTNCSTGEIALTGASICSKCPAGTYQNSGGQTECLSCGTGRYQDTIGLSTCVDCPTGKANPNTGRPNCDPCIAGQFMNHTGALTCDLCPPATSQPLTGQSNCTVCAAGSFNEVGGLALCSPCPVGSFGNTTALTVCRDCFGGTYQDTLGQSTCKGCELGTGSLAEGLSICDPCTLGRYANFTGHLQCDDCLPGTFSDAPGATACQPCAKGTFSISGQASSCTDCSRGSFSAALSSPSCTGCTSGTYQPFTRQTECLNCGVGTFSTGTNIIDCVSCAAGSYSNGTGVAQCSACPPGRFQDQPGSANCTACPVGSAMSEFGAVVCASCLSGEYANVTGLLACAKCAPGTFTSATGSVNCQLCPKGSSQPSTGADHCEPCDFGTFQPTNGSALCAPCDLGTAEPQTGSTSCDVCQPYVAQLNGRCLRCLPPHDLSSHVSGKFADVQDLNNCKDCAAGSYSNITGQTTCQPCRAGSHAENTGQSACTKCEIGRATTLPGQVTCQECAAGSYQNVTGQQLCAGCPLGTAQPQNGQTVCVRCSAGSYADVSGLPNCKACPQGQSVNVTGAKICADCAPSMYAPNTGQSVCDPCPAASFSEFFGQSDCQACPAGRAAPVPGNAQCPFCLPGTAQPAPGNETCAPCPLGTATSSFGAQHCTQCQAGSFANITGLETCYLCPGGTYQTDIGATSCVPCAAGFSSPLAGGAPACTRCNPGSYSLGGAFICTQCDPGQYQPLFQQTSCTNCTYGTIAAGSGARVCTACPVGQYIAYNGSATCEFCEPGLFQSQPGQTGCIACDIAKFSAQPGASSCIPCLPGTFGNQSLTANCYPCPRGQYEQQYGATVCQDCTEGKYLDHEGGQSCDLCPAGTYTTVNGTIDCTPCPPGQYQNGLGTTECMECGAGKYSLGGAVNCALCAPGTNSTELGRTTQCDPCPKGQAQAKPGSLSCDECGLGTFNPSDGAAVCLDCPFGYKGNATGLELCVPCDAGEFQNQRGKSNCTACQAGTFSPTPGQEQCVDCPHGSFGNTTGGLGCQLCEKGKFQDIPGLTLCKACTAGRFGSTQGESQCSRCPAGSFNIVPGAIDECTPCPKQQFQPADGATQCEDCPIQTFNDKTGQPNCIACPTGSYGNDTALETCYPCQAGKYNNREGVSSCAECPPGTASTAGQILCPVCPSSTATGVYGTADKCTTCQANSIPNTIRTECQCVEGYYIPNYNNEPPYSIFTCLECPTGANCDSVGNTFSNLQAASGYWRATNQTLTFYRCLIRAFCTGGDASASAFSPTSGSGCQAHREGIMCSYCSPGYRSGIGSVCTECPSGALSYGALALGAIGLGLAFLFSMYLIARSGYNELRLHRVVDPHDPNAILKAAHPDDDSGADSDGEEPIPDTPAPPGTAGAGGRGKTPAANGDVMNESSSDSESASDVNPPVRDSGTKSAKSARAQPPSTVELMATPVLPGTAVATAENDMQPIPNTAAPAASGPVGPTGDDLKVPAGPAAPSAAPLPPPAAGSPSVGAGSDADGSSTGESTDDGEGEDDDAAAPVSPRGAASAVGAKSPQHTGNRRDEPSSGGRDDWLQATTKPEMWAAQQLDDQRRFAGLYLDPSNPIVIRTRTIYGPPTPIGDITFKLKIFLSFLQIVTSVSTSLDVQWPETFTTIVQNLDVVNFQSLLQNVGSTDCISGVNYYVTFLIVCLTPIAVLIALLLFYILPFYLKLCCFRLYNVDARRRAVATFYRLFLYCLFLLYPGVSSKIILHYNCVDVEGITFLRADFRVQCNTDNWTLFALAALPLIMVYPIGIPLFFGVLLRNNRDRLQEPFIRAQLGFLYAGYRKHAWWFELVDLVHKLVVTSLLAFLTTAGQLTTAMCVIVVYLIIILRVHPYQRADDDQLHMYSQVELFLFVLAGWVFYKLDRPDYSARDDIIISISLIAVTIGFLGLFVYQAAYAAYRQISKMYARHQRQKLKKEQNAARAAAAVAGVFKPDPNEKPDTAAAGKPKRQATEPFALELANRPLTAKSKKSEKSVSDASESGSESSDAAKKPAAAAAAGPPTARQIAPLSIPAALSVPPPLNRGLTPAHVPAVLGGQTPSVNAGAGKTVPPTAAAAAPPSPSISRASKSKSKSVSESQSVVESRPATARDPAAAADSGDTKS